jgi:hypothetical protein
LRNLRIDMLKTSSSTVFPFPRAPAPLSPA